MASSTRDSRTLLLAVAVAVFLSVVLAGTFAWSVGSADADTTDEVTAVIPDDIVVAGEERTLEFRLVNRLEAPGTAMQGTVVRLEGANAPLSVRTSARAPGTIPGGTTRTVGFDVVVEEDAEPGSYDLELNVSYRVTEEPGDEVTGGPLDDAPLTEEADVNETISLPITVEERARFEVKDVETDIHVGEPGTLHLELENVGSELAHNATVEIRSVDPGFEVGAGTTVTRTFEGEWPVGETRTIELAGRTSDAADERAYELDTTVHFYDTLGVERRDEVRETGVDVGPEQSFTVRNVSSTLRVAEDGYVNATVVNDGNRSLTGVVAALESPNPNVVVRDAERAVGSLDPDEASRVSFRVGLREDAEPGERVLPLAVRYRTPGTDVVVSDRVDVTGVEAAPQQEFSIQETHSTLQVGQDGRVNATIVNEADRPVTGVIAVLESPNPNVAVRDPEEFAGTLAPGETAQVSYRVGLREDADPGDRVLPMVVRYRTPAGDVAISDQLDVPVAIGEQVDPFEVEAINRTITQGEEVAYEIEVRNVGDERYTDIEAQLFANPPLEVTDGEAYVPALDPGEATVIAFGLSADDDATPKTYPVSVDFRYEDEIGDRHLTDRLRVATEVVESDPWPLFAVALTGILLAILIGVGYWKRDRLGEFATRVRFRGR